jgi:hypothetical protein|tara:strand:+ start:165 stop:1637 length:1473 start_codon:yes stop_codon:yes gene_type:complete
MRKRFECQLQLGQTAIEKIQIPLKSRDELPPILAGLQWIFLTPEVNEAIFQVLEKKIQGNKKQTGRPGMDLWHILVLGVTRLGLDCDFDRLEHHANFDSLLREILGILSIKEEGRSFHQKTLSENVCMVDDELLTQINAIVTRFGRQEFKKKDDEKIAAKTDSYVLETNVHFPTDINLLWDAGRKSIELSSRLSDSLNLPCWRKAKDWTKRLKGQMRQVGRINQGGGKNKEERLHKAVKIYLSTGRELERKVAENVKDLAKRVSDASQMFELENIRYFHKMLVKQIDLIDRRILKGEKIPHEEKVFSLFEPHTEWITKGKAWPPMELGHKLLVTTDQYQLVLDYKVMEQTVDQFETIPLAKRLFENYGEQAFDSMSFDKGFSNEADRQELEGKVGLIVMPKKGKRRIEEQERESAPKFARLKNQHSAIESEINCLEHHGLNRCPDKGYHGFKRYVGFGILAYNLHKIGKQLIAKKKKEMEKYFDPLKAAA